MALARMPLKFLLSNRLVKKRANLLLQAHDFLPGNFIILFSGVPDVRLFKKNFIWKYFKRVGDSLQDFNRRKIFPVLNRIQIILAKTNFL